MLKAADKFDKILNTLDRHTAKLVQIEEHMATKEDLHRVEGKVDHLQTSVDKLTKKAGALETEKAANTAAHRRFDRRDQVFAEKLSVDIDRVDAAA